MIQIGYDENDEDAVEWNFGDIDFKHPEGWDPFNDKDGVFPKSLKEKIISFQDSDQITADYLGEHRTEEAEKWFDEL